VSSAVQASVFGATPSERAPVGGVYGFRQVENLLGEVEQLHVLSVLLLHRLPLLVGDDLPFRVGAVLADHHEGREEDRLERNDHRQEAVWVLLDAEADPAGEPDDVDVHERHRAGEGGDPVCDPVLHTLCTLASVLEKRRVRFDLQARGQVVPVRDGGHS
jgi:hypothetical protein